MTITELRTAIESQIHVWHLAVFVACVLFAAWCVGRHSDKRGKQ